MKKFRLFVFVLASVVIAIYSNPLYAQLDQLHGDQNYAAYGIHSGNQIRTAFHNDGQIGYRLYDPSSAQIQGEWPIKTGHFYLAKISTFWGAEVRCEDGITRPIVSEANGTRAGQNTQHSSGDASDEGDWWSMAPLPGFYNENPPQYETDQPWIAMSDKEWSWPETWPDKFDDAFDPGWNGFWNGYLGKNVFVADQESYYVMDDYNNLEFPFYPDSTDLDRRGLGLRISVRGLQWTHPALEDILFWLIDAQNIGTHSYNKMAFGMLVGSKIGGDGDVEDGGAFDLEHDLAYQYDADNIGSGGRTPVGYLGLAFLESSANPFDGIDNDGDGKDRSGPVITEDMFAAKTTNEGDSIVIINYNTYKRSLATMPAEGVAISFQDQDTTIMTGLVEEIPNNLIDDNLNGLIDENNGRTVGSGAMVYLNTGLKYIDYFNGAGSDNLLIDESRQDGIDNDADWDPLTDDVGLDGVAGTGDAGEGDGIPSSGFGTNLPGEPNIDKTDINESDQIGLTSFVLYDVNDPYQLYNDEKLWGALEPGYLDATFGIGYTDMVLGSGFFPFKPGERQRYAFGYIMGYPLNDLLSNKKNAQLMFDSNFRLESLTGLKSPSEQAARISFKLSPNYPNPFNPSTTIVFSLSASTVVTLKIYDVLGREVETLLEGLKPAGEHKIVWGAKNLSSGLYYCRMKIGNATQVRKLVLLR